MTDALSQMLADKPYILADGATGTNLFSMGLQTGDAPEFWNVDHPDRVSRHYRSFIEAGSDLVLTNTFGGNRYRLALHQGQDRVRELNYAAASLLREAADQAERKVLVLEKTSFPRYQIGESLLPVTVRDLADMLGVREKMAAAGFVSKRGATFSWGATPNELWHLNFCLLYTSPSPRDATLSRMPSSA